MSFTRTHAAFVIVLMTVAAYSNSTGNGFVWDDGALITENSYVRNSTYLGAAFFTDLFHSYTASNATHYRPLQTISYLLDYQCWGLNPAGYHMTNVLLHLACALLVWLLIEKLTGHRLLGTTCAALFAVHPTLTNAVAYIAGRADSMAFGFMLTSLLLLLEYRQHPRFPSLYAGSLLCFIAALFSRENALLFPALVALCIAIFPNNPARRWRETWRLTLPFIVLAVLFIPWRAAVLALQHKPILIASATSPLLRLQLFFRAIATYLQLLCWPAHLQMDRQIILDSAWWSGLTVAGILAVTGLAAMLMWSYRQAQLVFFGLMWFLITLLPMTGLLSLNATVAEHWLYVPCVGFFVAVGAIVQSVTGKRLAWAVCLVALAGLTARTIRRNQDWANPMTLFRATRAAAPYSANVRYNYSLELTQAGKTNEALAELERTEQSAPDFVRAKTQLARLYLSHGDLDSAQRKTEATLRLEPRNTLTWLQLAEINERRNRPDEARRDYLAALSCTPHVSVYLQYGSFLLRQRHFAEALAIADEAFRIEPGNANIFNLVGAVLAEQGRFALAMEAFLLARQLDRHSATADLNLSRLHRLQGDLPAAAAAYERALARQPNH